MRKLLISVIIIGIMSSCKKEYSDSFYPNDSLSFNDTTWESSYTYSKGFVDSLTSFIRTTNNIYTDSIPVSGGDLILNDSVQISFPSYAFLDSASGSVISSGTINVVLTLLKNKGDFIRNVIPTESGDSPLESGGSFYIQLSHNSKPVRMSSSYTVRFKDVSPNSAMSFFYGSYKSDSSFTWVQSTDTSNKVSIWYDTLANPIGYRVTTKQLQWINCDLFITATNLVRLNVLFPLNYTNKNTMVFAVFKNTRSIIWLNPDYTTKSFYADNIPLGTSMTIVSVSLIDNNLYWGYKDVTVSSLDNITVYPSQVSQSSINSFLNDL